MGYNRSSTAKTSKAKSGNEVDIPAEFDTGWSWVVAIAGTLTLFLGFGMYRSQAMLLVELGSIYDTSTTEISLIVFFTGIGYTVSAFLLMFGLGDIFHERALVSAAGILAFAGFTVTFFSKRVSDVYVLGFLTGTAIQLGDSLTASMLGKYFRKRIALGSGISFSGVSLAIVALPPFNQYLFDEYTYRGAALIFGAISLNSVVAGALMRPKGIQRTPEKTQGVETVATCDTTLTNLDSENQFNYTNKGYEAGKEHKNNKYTGATNESCAGQSAPRLESPPGTKSSSKKLSCFQLIKNFLVKPSSERGHVHSLLETMTFSLRFFKSFTFIAMESFVFLSSMGVECLIQFYPAMAGELGMTNYQSAFLLSILGGADIAGRLIFGCIGDCRCIEQYNMAAIPQLSLGCICFLFEFGTQFWSQIVLVVIIGLVYGTTYSYRPVLLADLFGIPTLLRRAGVGNVMTGLGISAAGPLLGFVRDSTGDFRWPLKVTGVIFFGSGLSLLSIGLLRFCKRRTGSKKNYNL